MLAGVGPFDVLVNGAVQPIEELVRVVLTGFLKRARDGLDHQHQDTTFKPVAGDVADTDLHARAILQDVVVVAADLVGRPHIGRDIHSRDRSPVRQPSAAPSSGCGGRQRVRRRDEHFRSRSLSLSAEIFVVRISEFLRALFNKLFKVLGVKADLLRHAVEGHPDLSDLVASWECSPEPNSPSPAGAGPRRQAR